MFVKSRIISENEALYKLMPIPVKPETTKTEGGQPFPTTPYLEGGAVRVCLSFYLGWELRGASKASRCFLLGTLFFA